MAGGRFRELLKKYGKVALGVHFSVSAASISGLYVAIRNNVDVESVFDKLHLPGLSSNKDGESSTVADPNQKAPPVEGASIEETTKSGRNRVAELAASSGGAFAVALLFNKALFPIRVPITIALTPAVAKALARRGLIRSPGIDDDGWKLDSDRVLQRLMVQSFLEASRSAMRKIFVVSATAGLLVAVLTTAYTILQNFFAAGLFAAAKCCE